MPEYPDILVYQEALARHLVGHALEGVRVEKPVVLKTVEPSPEDLVGRTVTATGRLGKKLALGFEGELWWVVHLMIAGRLVWKKPGAATGGRGTLMVLDFGHGTLVLTEAGTRRRARVWVVRGSEALAALDPGGLDLFAADLAAFRAALARENRTLKRALTDPRRFDGIGNAYSDEILFEARLSPLKRTADLDERESAALFDACRHVLATWTDRLRDEVGAGFPGKVTAFRPGMAVHGRYREPCPRCGAPVQRIVRAENEVDYCARCQTGGRLLSDRALSRLLHDDWPRTLDEWEEDRARRERDRDGDG